MSCRPGPVVVRADADAEIGIGHLMRCSALAEELLTRGAPVDLLVRPLSDRLREHVSGRGVGVRHLAEPAGGEADLRCTIALADRLGAAWVVVDGYRFDARYQAALTAAGLRVLWIDDDAHAASYTAEVIVNQNLHARPEMYRRLPPGTRLLLGPRYALLRPEFRRRREPPDRTSLPRRILVSAGGGDAGALIPTILEGIAGLDRDPIEVTIVAGPHASTSLLRAAADRLAPRARVLPFVEDMTAVMAGCDLAVSAAGSTVWELLALGVPSMLVELADNQAWTAAELDRRGAAVSLGPHHELTASAVTGALRDLWNDPPRLERMRRAGSTIVDARGAERVADHVVPATRPKLAGGYGIEEACDEA